MELKGMTVPEIGSPAGIETLNRMKDTGDAFMLVDGTGTVYGFYIITNIRQTGTYLNGLGVPQKVEFNLSLTRTDDKTRWILSDLFM